ncbi:MAG: hypothetical protein WBO97_03150 [Tepidiformaceae bacterium]
MYYEEARMRHEFLLSNQVEGLHRESLEQFRKLDRLQRSIGLVRARLGIRVSPHSQQTA